MSSIEFQFTFSSNGSRLIKTVKIWVVYSFEKYSLHQSTIKVEVVYCVKTMGLHKMILQFEKKLNWNFINLNEASYTLYLKAQISDHICTYFTL